MLRERRKYIRIDTRIPFNYKIKGSQEPEETAITKNVSPGGIRGLLDPRTKQGDWLELKIFIPTLEKPIPAIGKVVWTAEEKSGKIDAGIKFEEINCQMKNKFLEYICDLMISELEKLNKPPFSV